MCGIAGIGNGKRQVSERDLHLVGRMLELQHHRGPDGSGIHRELYGVLGHRRLSIIDLSESGAQPMSNETGSIWVTFNGEIYNFRELMRELNAAGHLFRSHCDTEVLVHGYEEWGMEGLLKRLRGMFAFAIYDAEAARSESDREFLFLARDHMGIKPLYYCSDRTANLIAFASEVKALVKSGAAPGEIDRRALACFLALGSVPAPLTHRKHVQSLDPGHYLAFGRSGLRCSEFWRLGATAVAGIDLSDVLTDCVQRHLISDVPVGVFLSGGVDSSAVALLSSRISKAAIRTLTIGFSEADYSEADEAREFAKQVGSEHHELPLEAKDFFADVDKILAAADQPTADGVNTYFVSRAAKRLGLTVVLSGLGGDEVFGGYPHYRNLVARRGPIGMYANAPSLVRRMAGTSAGMLGAISGHETLSRFNYGRGRNATEAYYMLYRGFFPPLTASRLAGLNESELGAGLEFAFSPLRNGTENGHIDPQQFQKIEMRRYLHDQLLRDSDVFSMAHSIELRVPLVDAKVAEAGLAIPAAEKVSAVMNKPKLVEAVGTEVLRRLAERPKRGFIFPFGSWLRSQAEELEQYAVKSTLLDSQEIRRCWQRFRDGRVHWSRAWSTVVLRAVTEA